MTRKLIAILRGLEPDMAADTAAVLLDAGITMIEVPLNSPNPFRSIELMANAHDGRGVFGAGTVLSIGDVAQLKSAGGTFVVSPNCDLEVIRTTKAAGLRSYPGVFTASECFAALKAGADALKIFPAEVMGPSGIKALRAVLPSDADVYAVGGAAPDNFDKWAAAGACGFGLGSFLFKPGRSLDEIGKNAVDAVAAYDNVFKA